MKAIEESLPMLEKIEITYSRYDDINLIIILAEVEWGSIALKVKLIDTLRMIEVR